MVKKKVIYIALWQWFHKTEDSNLPFIGNIYHCNRN